MGIDLPTLDAFDGCTVLYEIEEETFVTKVTIGDCGDVVEEFNAGLVASGFTLYGEFDDGEVSGMLYYIPILGDEEHCVLVLAVYDEDIDGLYIQFSVDSTPEDEPVELGLEVPAALVGEWSGEEQNGSTFTMTINADGTATFAIANYDMSSDLELTAVEERSNGRTYCTFASEEDGTVYVWIDGNGNVELELEDDFENTVLVKSYACASLSSSGHYELSK